MPESPPNEYMCGTHAPGWLNGRHPSVAEGKKQTLASVWREFILENLSMDIICSEKRMIAKSEVLGKLWTSDNR
ncbi:hypothetical protein pdam_00008506 [Pocillopora damicornis]|uniref:Uncharacterized protein n=1 Tax=Pocillopora damicornis TaxID=46731 RepID=A0A3M6U4F3_POCDA|nr:hypothetical protein pdam_00008506 [Pocillopora damicornis]